MTDLRQAAQAVLDAWDSPLWKTGTTAAKIADLRAALEQQAEPVQEPYESPYNPNPVEYQYHYLDGSWRCSIGEVIYGMHPDCAQSLYALKDNT